MDQRLTETRKHDPVQVGQIVQAVDQSLKRVHRHRGFRVFPYVANAGKAEKVAPSGWLDIQLSNVRQAGVEDQIALPFVEPVFGFRRDVPTLEKRMR
jgi:hypothetical protein